MNTLENTRTINNDDTSVDKAGEIEFTMEFACKKDFEEWLSEEKTNIRWSKRSSTGVKCGPRNKQTRSAIYEWTETYYCPFAGQKRSYTPTEGVKRRKTGTSMKVGCKAMLKVSKKIGDECVKMNISHHTNHTRESNFTWTKQRLSPLVRKWLENVVECGNDWNACKTLLRPDEATLDVLESGKLLELNSPVQVQEARRPNSNR